MAEQLGVQVILCDAAQSDSQTGKVHMLGAGWSSTSSPTASMAVAVLVKIPPEREDELIPLTVRLVDADDQTVEITTAEGGQQVVSRTQVQSGHPVWAHTEARMDVSFALNVPPLPLEPGCYEWRAEVGDQFQAAPFTVRRRP